MRLVWLGMAMLLGSLGACGGPATGSEGPECDGSPCEDDGPAPGTDTGEVATSGDDDGTAGDDDDDDDAPGTEEGSGDTAPVDGGIPCEVQELLAAECWMCHDETPSFGAPMSLVTIDDFSVPAVSDVTRPVFELVLERTAADTKPMPPSGLLEDAERSVLVDWIDAGMPEADQTDCEPETPPDGWGPEALPCEPDAMFTAFAPDGQGDGFAVPTVTDLYQCFVLDSPFSPDQQGIAWAPVIDDERVVHHMLLLSSDDASLQPGSVVPDCGSLTLSTSMIMGWAPGSPNFIMPDEAGLELPNPGQRLVLQIHYNNAAGHLDAVDASGFAMCTTDTPRDNTAATLWLGTTEIDIPANGTATATGECDTERTGQPTTVMMSWPHMHEFGTTFTTEVVRQGGQVETIVDVPAFNFDNQIYYEHDPPFVLQPGDILRTTCNYDNPTGSSVGFGEDTGDEMCFNFALVYPIDAYDVNLPLLPPTAGRFCYDGLLPI